MEAIMPEYLAPGVFIEEIERGPRPIEGVSTSTAAFLGETERGPTRPRLVTSFAQYRRYFGDPLPGDPSYVAHAITGFFDNGGQLAYVCRIAANDAVTAGISIPTGANSLDLEASGPGAWGGRTFVKITDSTTRTGGAPVGFRLQVAYWSNAPAAGSDPFAEPATGTRPTVTETFDDLVWDNAKSADFYGNRLEKSSALIRLKS